MFRTVLNDYHNVLRFDVTHCHYSDTLDFLIVYNNKSYRIIKIDRVYFKEMKITKLQRFFFLRKTKDTLGRNLFKSLFL